MIGLLFGGTYPETMRVWDAKLWLIANAKRDQLTGSIIPGQAFRHPDGTIMTVRSPIDGMRIFELCSYCYCAMKASSMERHVKNCPVHLDGASTAINNNINRDHVIIDPSSPPAAPGESSVDNPEPPLTVSASGGSRKRRNIKSNAKGEKKRKGNAAESTKTPSESLTVSTIVGNNNNLRREEEEVEEGKEDDEGKEDEEGKEVEEGKEDEEGKEEKEDCTEGTTGEGGRAIVEV